MSHFLTGSFIGATDSSADYLALNKQYFAAGYTISYLQRKKHSRPVVDWTSFLGWHCTYCKPFCSWLLFTYSHVRGTQLQNMAQKLPIYTLSSCILTFRLQECEKIFFLSNLLIPEGMLSRAPQPRMNLADIWPCISLWVRRETDFIFCEWDMGAYISKILFWGAAGKHSCPQPVWQLAPCTSLLCEERGSDRLLCCALVCAWGT